MKHNNCRKLIHIFPKKITGNFDGYYALIEYYHRTLTAFNKEITLDFSDTEWFNGNLCAVLGAINTGIEERKCSIRCINISDSIKTVFAENKFLFDSNYNNELTYKESANHFSKFNPTDEKAFAEYVEQLLSAPYLPSMSELLKKKICRSILEIFNNAKNHGRSRWVFSCGQYYPQSQKLDFTVVDLGHTIRKNVREYLNNKITAKKAIEWAVYKGNTTRTGPVPGGLGFSLIRDFLKLNKGTIEIISSNGFWQEKNDSIFTNDFAKNFVGTIVNIEFNLNDDKSYILTEEVNSESMF